MATVTGFTAERMQEIEDSAIVDGEVVGGNLILTKHDGGTINAGSVIGPEGPEGPMSIGIPGEVRMWPGATLPDIAYGLWVWANGDAYLAADYPYAYNHISRNWDTAYGRVAPAAGTFRVPDLRGVVPAGLDAMPVGSTRVNRVTRSVAIIIAGSAGEEEHIITISEVPAHAHVGDDHRHIQGAHNHDFYENYTSFREGGGTTTMLQKQSMSAGTLQLRNTEISPDYYTKLLSETGAMPNTGSVGGGNEHENMQPTVFVPYIVKLDD